MRKSVRERRPWAVGLASILVIAAGVTGAFSINKFKALRGVYALDAELRDAAGLQSGNEVRVAGVKVGQVTGVSLTDRAAIVEMEIQRDVLLPIETKLEVKLKTILGQKFIDLQIPRTYLTAASGDGDASTATRGYYDDDDVIPLENTRVPFEIHQAATEGTAVLEEIDKESLREMLDVLSETVGTSKEEINRFVGALEDAGSVLEEKNPEISSLLRNTEKLTATLAESDEDLGGIIAESADLFTTLAERRATVSSLLEATNNLTNNFGLLIQASRRSVQVGAADLNSILLLAEGELDTIEEAIAALPDAQELFGRPLTMGRFLESHVCAITTEDVCVPWGSPEDPKVPTRGTQPPKNFSQQVLLP